MVARHRWRNDEGDLEWVDTVLRWGYVLGDRAEEGKPETVTVIVDDPDMTLDFVAHRRWLVYEDDSESEDDHIIFDGFIIQQEITHGGDEVTRPEGRIWTLTLVDLNTLFTNRAMTGSDATFPEQTDVERVLQVAASEEMGYFDDLTFVFAGDTEDMDERDGRGQYTGQILDECAQQSGKNYWIGSRGIIGEGSELYLWYGPDSHSSYSSPLALSNDPADLIPGAVDDGSATTYPIGADTRLKRDGARVYSGAYVQGEKHSVKRTDAGTLATFTVSGRDIVVPAPELKTKAKVIRRALRILEDHDTQDEVITTTIVVLGNKVSMIRRGMRISFTATHLPGYEDGRILSVLSAKPSPIGRRAGFDVYSVALELQGPGSAAPWACPLDGSISATPSQLYPPLGGTTTDEDGVIWYTSNNAVYFPGDASIDFRDGPQPSATCHGFGFPDYGAGGGDAGGVSVGSTVGFVFAGPGTASAVWANYNGTFTIYWEVLYETASGIAVQASGTMAAPDTLVVDVGDLPGDAVSCYRQLTMRIDNSGTGNKGTFAGLTWAAEA